MFEEFKNPIRWEYGGIGHYPGQVCPKCGSSKFEHLRGRISDIAWFECEECHWKGDKEDMVSEGEYKNKNRTELIDNILK